MSRVASVHVHDLIDAVVVEWWIHWTVHYLSQRASTRFMHISLYSTLTCPLYIDNAGVPKT